MMSRFFRSFGTVTLIVVAVLASADTSAPTQLQFLGTASIFGYSKHDKSMLLRQPDCSITKYSFYPLLALTPTTNFQNTLHQLAGLTTVANKFPHGCKDPTLGIASTPAAYLGKTSAGAYQAVHALIDHSSDLVVYAYAPASLSSTSTTLATNVSPQVIGVDLNGDGFIDVIATGVTSPTTNQTGVGVFLNNGDGTFKPVVVYPMTIAANVSFIIDDVNGDGVPDIVVPNTSSGGATQLTTLIGKGDGSFTVGPSSPIATIIVNETSQTLVTGDFNGDGKKDVLMADGNLYTGNGDGSFAAARQVLPGNVYTNYYNAAFAVGDFNGDGKLDLAEEISVPASGLVVVFLGNGDGTFTQGGAYEVTPQPGALVATDIDGDGNTDLVVARSSNGAFSASGGNWFYQVLMGHGNGTFNAAPVTLIGPYGSGGNGVVQTAAQWPSTGIYALADFNGDGHLDLLEPQPSGTNVGGSTLMGLTISTGNGDGSFGSAAVSAINFIPAVVAAGDLNGDGKADAVSVGTNSAGAVVVGVLFGNGGTSLNGEQDYPLPAGSGIPVRVVIGDFNGDGLPDIAVAIRGGPVCSGCSSGVYVLFGQPSHTFAAPVLIDSSLQPIIAAGDLNGDGRVDLVVADTGLAYLTNAIPGAVHVYLGNADKTFTASTPVIPTLYFSDVTLADVNKDGKPDIVVGAEDAPGGNTMVAVLPGNGKGGFGTLSKILITGGIADPPPVIAVADFNGDGNPDIAFFLPGDFSGVLFGVGDGTFPTQVNMGVFSPSFPGAPMAVDLTGDHKPDLIFADAAKYGLVSLVNQWGLVTSAAATTTTLTSSATSVATGQALTLTAAVAAASGGAVTPTGSVTFMDGSKVLGSGALDASGKATFPTSSLAQGAHSLSAVYGGSTAFAGSSSATVTVQVGTSAQDFSASANPTSLTLAAGASGTLALTLTPLNGSTQTVTVSCGGLPANATCGFSPGSSVTLDGSKASTVTITIATDVMAALGKAVKSPEFASFGGGIGGAMLLLSSLGAAIRRRMGRALAATAAVLALASCGGGGGGGSGSPNGITPAGTYPVTISLVSGATTHTVSVTLIVG